MQPSPALDRVRRGRLCSGCGGCALVSGGAVGMTLEAPGFLRPEQTGDLSAEAEAHIAAICPGLGQEVEARGRPDDVLWGPYLDMRTGWSTDETLRHAASSGGALSALLVQLLDSGAVDGVIQTGPGLPAVATATGRSTDRDDVLRATGSRYAPSAPLAALAPYLEAGSGRHAVVGKPCDIAALRALEARDPRVSERFPYMLSFFCAGVPSQAGAEEVLSRLGVAPDEVQAFRYRGMGWPGRATATLGDGSERSMTYMESWGAVLSRHVQHRCKICADGTGTAADIVCADAWEADADGYPVFEEQPGISLIVARTETGRALMTSAEEAGHLVTAPFDVATLADIQPGQRGRRRALGARLLGLKVTGYPVPQYRGLRVAEAARQNPLAVNLRNFLGMVRRAVRGRV